MGTVDGRVTHYSSWFRQPALVSNTQA